MTVAYADAIGEGGAGGTGTYYLAAAFDAVFLQPASLLSVTGLAAAGLYGRGLLDRWRVVPHVFAREVRVAWGALGCLSAAGPGRLLVCAACPQPNLPAHPPTYPPTHPLEQEYKSALSFLVNKRATGAEQRAMRETLVSLGGQVVRGIAQGRGLTEKQVRAGMPWRLQGPSACQASACSA